MSETGRQCRIMQHISTAFLIIALVIVVNPDGVTAQFFNYDKTDQLAQEAKNRAVTIIDGPKYVAPPSPPPKADNTQKPEHRPPSKPPIIPTTPDKNKPKYEYARLYYGIQNLPPLRSPYSKPLKIKHAPNTVYKYHKVIPLQQNGNQHQKPQRLVFAASTNKPSIVAKSPKFSIPVETINGIRSDFVRPPHVANTTTSTTTVPTTTTKKYLRTKRIWPKRIAEKMNATLAAANKTSDNKTIIVSDDDLYIAPSHHRYVFANKSTTTVAPTSTTRGPYRRVTRVPKKKASTPPPANYTTFEPNDWVPIVPSHYPSNKTQTGRTHARHRGPAV